MKKRKYEINIFKFVVFFIFMNGFIITVIFGGGIGEDEIKKVNCYDNNGNRIIGVICEEKIYRINKEQAKIIIFLVTPIMNIIMFLFSLERRKK